MDLYLQTESKQFETILLSLGFKKKNRKSYNYYYLKQKGGRIHAMFALVADNTVYCDLHFDNTIHFLFFGVDFKNKSETFFEKNIKSNLEKNQISFEIKKVSWFSKRNKSIFTGFRL